MWQAPSQRLRALVSSKRREKDRLRRPLHFLRTRAEIKIPDLNGDAIIVDARVILNDISPKGVGLFSTQALLPGQDVAITLEEPKRIYLKGRIVWCQEHDVESHVLSESRYSYRIGIAFVFETPEEFQAVQHYCEVLQKEHIHRKASA